MARSWVRNKLQRGNESLTFVEGDYLEVRLHFCLHGISPLVRTMQGDARNLIAVRTGAGVELGSRYAGSGTRLPPAIRLDLVSQQVPRPHPRWSREASRYGPRM